MRSAWILGLLAVVLIAIAVVARTGWFSREAPGEPASRSMREAMKAPRWSTAELAALQAQFAGATVSPTDIRSIIRAPGTGDEHPRRGQLATVNYEGRLLRDGTKFDSSFDRGQPIQFPVGVGRVIAGWDEVIPEMKRGERRTVVIPWWLAYGARGAPPRIPSKASLVFEIELLDFQ
jgi:FKBP-type peptidyl-prolyl cis-trans isomerase